VDDFGDEEESCITLTEEFAAEALVGLADFSEVLFFLSQVPPASVITGARNLRSNEKWPKVGSCNAPRTAPIALAARSVAFRVEDKKLFVSELDAHGRMNRCANIGWQGTAEVTEVRERAPGAHAIPTYNAATRITRALRYA
jgi:hypothetical protein